MSRFKHTQILGVVTCLAVVAGSVGTGYAQEAPTEDEFTEAKQAFEQVWESASQATKRQAELQTSIKMAQTNVEKAKIDLENLAAARGDIRRQIAEQRALIDALAAQRAQVAESKARYMALAHAERERIVAYVRFAAVQEMVVTETGPVAGGAVVRKMLRGTLSDNIDAELGVVAVARAREKLIGQLIQMAYETDAVQTRLHAVAYELDVGMLALEKKNKSLGQSMDERTASIDDGWRTLSLSQQELERVQEETAGVTAKVIEMQQSLVRINQQLKESKLNALKDELAEVEAKHEELQKQRRSLESKADLYGDIIDGELKAWKAAQDARNSDKRQYQKVDEVERLIQQKRDRKKEIDAILDGTAPAPKYNDATVAAPDPRALAAESKILEGTIPYLEEKLSYMEDGIPEESADAYISARAAAKKAKADRATVLSQLEAMNSQVAAVVAKSSEVSAKIDTVNRESGLDGLPPIFQWPVRGVITAGFYDSDYQVVFGVPHKAIDVAVPQGTPVKAVAEGVVFAVRLGGATGYTYVLIGHRNGYASLYGHLSQVYVKAGDLVDYSTIIGASGGMPGTVGAGPMTTGAHLHVELMENGAHVNPQAFLP